MTDTAQILHALKSGRVPAATRLWARVDRSAGPDGCWPWSGAHHQKGYGTIASGGRGPIIKTHRLAWTLTYGPIPAGMHVLHHCDNPPCCNPAHLWLGTNADNVRDRVAKGREASHAGERNGRAKLTFADVTTIRARRSQGERRDQIASEYGVDGSTVWRITSQRYWRKAA